MLLQKDMEWMDLIPSSGSKSNPIPTPTPSQSSSYEDNGNEMDIFDELTSSQSVSSSTDDIDINIIKENKYKEGRKVDGGYGNGYGFLCWGMDQQQVLLNQHQQPQHKINMMVEKVVQIHLNQNYDII